MRTWKSLLRRFVLDRWLVRWLVIYPLFWVGYGVFAYTKRTPWIFYFCFRELYSQTRGRLNRRLATAITRRHRPFQISASRGVLGDVGELEANLAAAVAALETDGYHVFPIRLSGELCDELRTMACTLPAKLVPCPAGQIGPLVFDPQAPRAPKYDFEQQRLIANPVIQRLLADRTLLSLAYRYLKAPPINDLIAMWWSAPFGSRASSEAAQLFHFDLDRIKFLKIFFYLTDVNSEKGPHMYVQGTHEARPPGFFEDRRFGDDEIVAAFRSEEIVELVGPVGTIIAVDTIGLHKGKALTTGSRLILQFEFTNSLFGAPYERPSLPEVSIEDLRQALAELPDVFQRFGMR